MSLYSQRRPTTFPLFHFLAILGLGLLFDPTAVTSCQIFEDLDEDATPYFDCLANHSRCSPETGLPQIGGWETCTDLLPRNKGDGG
jgi:hypothetical protein